MSKYAIAVVATFLLGLGSATLAVTPGPQSGSASRAPYNPFAMSRAAESEPGTKDYENLRRRLEITKSSKNRVRPPHKPGNRSPHQPGKPYHDKDGDGVEDHGGHGPSNNPGNPPPYTPPGGGIGTNPGGNTPGNGNGNGNGTGRRAPVKRK